MVLIMKQGMGNTLHFSVGSFIQQIFTEWIFWGVVPLLSIEEFGFLSCRQQSAIKHFRAGKCMMKCMAQLEWYPGPWETEGQESGCL